MIFCPVCENAQPSGDVCEVCGQPFADAVPAALMDGLEPTRFGAVEVLSDGVPGLEPTAHGPVHVDAEPPLELERTAVDPVDVTTDVTPDLERIGDGIAEDARTAVPVLLVCRYCRAPALPDEKVCSGCGMRLPVFAARPAGPDAVLRLCSCGAPVRGQVCPACGARVSSGA